MESYLIVLQHVRERKSFLLSTANKTKNFHNVNSEALNWKLYNNFLFHFWLEKLQKKMQSLEKKKKNSERGQFKYVFFQGNCWKTKLFIMEITATSVGALWARMFFKKFNIKTLFSKNFLLLSKKRGCYPQYF